MIPKRTAVKLLGLGVCVALLGCKDAPKTDATLSTYYLVRHAEKVLDVKDPALTEAGAQRAQDLAERLDGVKLSKIYSTDTKRTRDTAQPTADAQGLNITIYDASDLEGFAKQITAEKGHILVVGHSNTTPDLAKHLGGQAGEPIVEATEYDRFYIVKRLPYANDSEAAAVTTKLERFGTLSPTQ